MRMRTPAEISGDQRVNEVCDAQDDDDDDAEQQDRHGDEPDHDLASVVAPRDRRPHEDDLQRHRCHHEKHLRVASMDR